MAKAEDLANESIECAASQSAADLPPLNLHRRKCLLVLGMHRSGTSAISGLLAKLGVKRPKRELPPQNDNPLGFFEPSEIVAIHDRLLSMLNSNWFDWRQLPEGWSATQTFEETLAELELAIRHDFDGEETFLVKDPRICRFIDLWIALADRIGVELIALHIFRNPIEVACSLRARNGFDAEQAHMLWLRHVLEAEAFTRTMPRAFVSYERLVADGLPEVEGALRFVELDIEVDDSDRAEAGMFIDPTLKRQNADVGPLSKTLGRWISTTYAMLERLRLTPTDQTALKTLDRLRSEFDGGCEIFGPALMMASEKANGLQQEAQRMRASEDERDVLMRSLRAVTWVADKVPSLESELELFRGRCSEMNDKISRMAELETLILEERKKTSMVEVVAARVPELETHLAASRAMVESHECSMRDSAALQSDFKIEHERLVAEYRDRLSAKDVEFERLREEIARTTPAVQRVTQLEVELEATRKELDQTIKLTLRVAELEAEIDSERRSHAETRQLADCVLATKAEKLRLSDQLIMVEMIADRVPQLERALADAESRASYLSKLVSSRKALIRRFFIPSA